MDENMNPRTLRVREALMQATLELVGDRPVSKSHSPRLRKKLA